MLHENALAPQTQIGFLWLLCWASLVINWGGCTTFPSQLAFVFLVRCGYFFLSFFLFFSHPRANGAMVVFGAFKNKYPAICSNYDDLQESGNTQYTHTTPKCGGGFLIGARAGHDFQGLGGGGRGEGEGGP